MDSTPKRQVYSLSVGENVHRFTSQLRLIGGLIVLALILVILGAFSGIVVRLIHPRDGALSIVLLSGFIGIVALVAGTAALEVSDRRARKAKTMGDSVAIYRTGCVIAGGSNFVAGLCTVGVIFANGLSDGLWLPMILVAVVNIIGMVLAVPRIKHISRLHYSPTLPCSRI